MKKHNPTRQNKLEGLLLGMAIGDALGLPLEGLSPERIENLLDSDPLGYRFLLGRGMVSDDTEHLCMTAQAILSHPEDPKAFARSLAWKLRFWLMGLPAGIGFGTLRAIIKLCLGFPPSRSGVFTAGNGPAMRSPVIGAAFSDDPELLRSYVKVSTRLTHTDPKAEQGALAVALCASHAMKYDPYDSTDDSDPTEFLIKLAGMMDDPELAGIIRSTAVYLETDCSVREFADDIGISGGVSGYMYHTVPIAIFAWLRHSGDYYAAIESVIRLGGDTDTTGAIVGALAGASVGETCLPGLLMDGMADWPRSVSWIRSLGSRLDMQMLGDKPGPLPLFWPGIVPRNLLFMITVLVHGVKRMLPPY